MESTTTELRKGWNLAWYHHLTHIACVQRLRGLRQKPVFLFSKLACVKTFLLHSTCNIKSHIQNFQPFLTSFSIFHAFNDLFWAKWPCNWKPLQLNSEKVETCDGIIIWTTYHVFKSWEDYGKNWMHFVHKLDHLFQSTRVWDENSSVWKAFHFSTLILTQDFFWIQHATFKTTY